MTLCIGAAPPNNTAILTRQLLTRQLVPAALPDLAMSLECRLPACKTVVRGQFALLPFFSLLSMHLAHSDTPIRIESDLREHQALPFVGGGEEV